MFKNSFKILSEFVCVRVGVNMGGCLRSLPTKVERQTDRSTDRQFDKQTDRQTEKQTDRKNEMGDNHIVKLYKVAPCLKTIKIGDDLFGTAKNAWS